MVGAFERLSATPTAAMALTRLNAAIDVRHVLGSICVPTLVIHRTHDVRVKIAGGRFLAHMIPGARFLEHSGRDHLIWTGDIDRVVDDIEEFVTGARPAAVQNRVLATILSLAWWRRRARLPRSAIEQPTLGGPV